MVLTDTHFNCKLICFKSPFEHLKVAFRASHHHHITMLFSPYHMQISVFPSKVLREWLVVSLSGVSKINKPLGLSTLSEYDTPQTPVLLSAPQKLLCVKKSQLMKTKQDFAFCVFPKAPSCGCRMI